MRERRKTKEVKIGGLAIGGTHEIAIQSMLNVPALDIAGNVEQAKRLEEAGCQIIRLAVPEMGAVKTVEAIKNAVGIPLVADIHFDYRLALESAAPGWIKFGSIQEISARIPGSSKSRIPVGRKGIPYPHWRQFRFRGAPYSCQIWKAQRRSNGGKCSLPCPFIGKV